MSKLNAYLRFPDNTEGARKFYRNLFGGDKSGGVFARFSDASAEESISFPSEKDESAFMQIELPLPGGHVFIDTDTPESMVFKLNLANSYFQKSGPDTKARAKYLADALSVDGKITVGLQDIFWGPDYFSCTDKFGVQWMFVCDET